MSRHGRQAQPRAPGVRDGADDPNDPMPDDLADQARAAFGSRRVGVELARLTDEYVATPADRESTGLVYQLGFESAHCTITLTVSTDRDDPAGALSLVGSVEPAAPTAARLEVGGARIDGTVKGALVTVSGAGHGPARLCLEFPGNGDPCLVETEWVTL